MPWTDMDQSVAAFSTMPKRQVCFCTYSALFPCYICNYPVDVVPNPPSDRMQALPFPPHGHARDVRPPSAAAGVPHRQAQQVSFCGVSKCFLWKKWVDKTIVDSKRLVLSFRVVSVSFQANFFLKKSLAILKGRKKVIFKQYIFTDSVLFLCLSSHSRRSSAWRYGYKYHILPKVTLDFIAFVMSKKYVGMTSELAIQEVKDHLNDARETAKDADKVRFCTVSLMIRH